MNCIYKLGLKKNVLCSSKARRGKVDDIFAKLTGRNYKNVRATDLKMLRAQELRPHGLTMSA
jgi:hypothetical protein